MSTPHPPYPAYARSERIADGAMHALGLSAALAGAVWLVWQAVGGGGASLAVYGAALVATFAASAIYHMTPWEQVRPVLRRIDHAAIYVKIAGTYTPLVAMIGGLSAWLVLAAVWALAAYGVAQKLFFWSDPTRNGTWLYLAMGWLSVLLVGSMFAVLPGATLILIAIGGGLYTLGTVFHHWESLKFSNAIWHGHVVAASACFFVAIALGSAAVQA
jgi:hemolysin III